LAADKNLAAIEIFGRRRMVKKMAMSWFDPPRWFWILLVVIVPSEIILAWIFLQ
jgi:hypothetical protein